MICTLACLLMFGLEVFIGLFYYDLQGLIRSFVVNTGLPYDIIGTVTDMLFYIVYLTVPFAIANLIFKFGFKEKDNYQPLHKSPKKLLLYIPAVIGGGYAINIINETLFGSFFDKFLTPEEPLPTSVLGIILTFISTAVLPALLEEWAFRKTILKNLLPYGKIWAMLFSSFLFGIMHLNPLQSIFASFIGFLMALCYEYTRSIKITMLVHFLNNAISVTFGYLAQDETAAADIVYNLLSSLIVYGCIGCFIAAAIYYLITGFKHKKIAFDKPAHIGRKLYSGEFIRVSLLNPGTILFLLGTALIFCLTFLV